MSGPVRTVPYGPTSSDVDPPFPSAEELRPLRARILNPSSALILKGQEIRSTVYVADELLVSTQADASKALPLLTAAANAVDLDVVIPDPRPDGQAPGAQRIRLVPKEVAAAEPDAWVVLQKARAAAMAEADTKPDEAATALDEVGLNHLLWVMPGGGGLIGVWEPNGGAYVNALYANSAISEYSRPGLGGRAPVRYLGSGPQRRSQVRPRRPVVTVLDMGCSEHEWLPTQGDIVDRTPQVHQSSIGLPGDGTEVPFTYGPMDGRLHGLTGHGTFVCGLVRQTCPDAKLVSARVVPPDGLLDEGSLIEGLQGIQELARQWVEGTSDRPIDVVSLSLGYYPEQFDQQAAAAITAAIQSLGHLGVVVIAAVGNDATQRVVYPAGLADRPPAPDSAPVISVGAENPDGTIAIFSNGGTWVRHWEAGVAVVSSMPRVNGGGNASAEAHDPSNRIRRSLDPDNYPDYASWSGTSFAAPVLAGRIAQQLLHNSEAAPSHNCGSHHPDDTLCLAVRGREAAVRRAWAAIKDCVPALRDVPR